MFSCFGTVQKRNIIIILIILHHHHLPTLLCRQMRAKALHNLGVKVRKRGSETAKHSTFHGSSGGDSMDWTKKRQPVGLANKLQHECHRRQIARIARNWPFIISFTIVYQNLCRRFPCQGSGEMGWCMLMPHNPAATGCRIFTHSCPYQPCQPYPCVS